VAALRNLLPACVDLQLARRPRRDVDRLVLQQAHALRLVNDDQRGVGRDAHGRAKLERGPRVRRTLVKRHRHRHGVGRVDVADCDAVEQENLAAARGVGHKLRGARRRERERGVVGVDACSGVYIWIRHILPFNLKP